MLNPIHDQLKLTKATTIELIRANEDQINQVLVNLADSLTERSTEILVENKKDLDDYPDRGPKYQRLKLDESKIQGIADSLRKVATLPSPLGKVLEERKVPIGLQIQRVSVPLGVVGMIYESRPNVTVDAFALCFKSGNGCVLKGGSDAKRSNQILVKIIQQVLGKNGFSPNLVYLLPPERESVNQLFSAHNLVDVIIPRGSQSLINFVRENSKIPVIETGAGVCHVFVDESADLAKAQRIVTNSKVSRPFACNALDTLLVHQDRLTDLPKICAELLKSDVTIRVRPQAWEVLSKHYPKNLLKSAETEDYGREFLGYAMALQVVQNLDAALSHIQQFSSGHSESIVSENQTNIDRFLKEVDAAAVYANTSLAFTDGGEFGLGAEIGISTQKLHARGPFALEALTSYKWIVRSNGAVR